MRVLIYGWEFPPHISGGLGTASYGLTNGMAEQSDMDITLVVPKLYGDEDILHITLVGANRAPIVYHDHNAEYLRPRLHNEAEMSLYQAVREHIYDDFRYRCPNDLGRLEFSGAYPDNLLEEINNYSIVAGVIARTVPCDIIHSYDWLAYPAGIHTKIMTERPLVIRVHATDLDRSRGNVNPQVYAIERQRINYADAIVYVSNLTRRTVIDKYGQSPDKVSTVHNAVEPLSPELLALPNKQHMGDKVITFLERITMQKGPEYFVEAAHKVLQHTDGIRFAMAGNSDMMDKMTDLVARKRIADHFHFTGFLRGQQVYEILRSSDVYVMPSISGPFGISPPEAIQCDVLSIISKQSGCAEIPHYTVKIDYQDVDAVANAMRALVSYPTLHEHLRQRGIEEVNNIVWSKAGLRLRAIYGRLV